MEKFFALTTPCVDCPFRKDIAFYLTPKRRREIAEHLRHDGTFQCHKTTDGEWDDQGIYHPTDNEIHCAGALLVLLKSGELAANWRLRTAVGWQLLDLDALDQTAQVFATLDDFIEGNPF